MRSFDYFQPTKLCFGPGRVTELGGLVAPLGTRALLVYDPALDAYLAPALERVRKSLAEAGVESSSFSRIQPNPTLDDVQSGAEAARELGATVVVGMGGGSAMDTARAIAVAATHPGTAMDYLYFSETQPTEKTLPFVLIPTTSGTGSHMSCCAVITDTARQFKSALWNRETLFPRATLVDPELMVTMPTSVTAATGFDVFTHAFESFINVGAMPYVDMLAMEAIRTVATHLPDVLKAPENIEHRTRMAWADTLAGCSIANVGTTLPHAMGQPISGHFPAVNHGQSLAAIYPAFLDYTWSASPAKFAATARVFNPKLANEPDEKAAAALTAEVVKFLETIGMSCKLEDFGITPADVEAILVHCMEFPDVNVNPIVPDTEKVRELYLSSFGNPGAA